MPVSPEPSNTTPHGGTEAAAHQGETAEECGSTHAGEDCPRARDQVIEAQPPDDEEDVQRHPSLRAPDAPTKEEIAEHQASGHLPYRSWCPDCVEAFGRERPHKPGGNRSIPLISCDYLFITPRGPLRKGELSEEEQDRALKVLVAHCSATKCMFAHAVPKKGVDEKGYIVDQLKRDITWLGHSRIVLKGDNEPALVQVLAAAAAALKCDLSE